MEIIFLLIITAIVMFIFWDTTRLQRSYCPKCKSKWSIQKVNKINLGPNFRNGNSQRYRVYYKCTKCGHNWSEIKEIADKHRGRVF